MEGSKTEKEHVKRINVVVEPLLSLCIDRANELHITREEYMDLQPTNNGFVLLYYR